ncbi:hypothetical protein H4S00_006936, partial [Coemansia sp. D1744]
SVEPADASIEEVAAPAAETSEPEAPAVAVDESPDFNETAEAVKDTEPVAAEEPVEPENADDTIAAEDTATTRDIAAEVQDDTELVADENATELTAADQSRKPLLNLLSLSLPSRRQLPRQPLKILLLRPQSRKRMSSLLLKK